MAYTIKNLVEMAKSTQVSTKSGEWVPARPISSGTVQAWLARAVDAWHVLTGKYDAVKWEDK